MPQYEGHAPPMESQQLPQPTLPQVSLDRVEPPPFSDAYENEKLDHFSSKESATATDELDADDGPELYDENGREKVLQTAADFSRALVSLDDDPSLPIHTFRMWFTGVGLAVFGGVLGMLFQFRPQVITLSALFLQLLAYMLGMIFQRVIPGPGSRVWRDNRFWRFMNPGPFNLKEHVAAQILANTTANAATACFVFASDDLFYNMTINAGNAIFTVLASQLVGYGFAGMFRSFLVYPTIMLYPLNLIYVNLFDALHRGKGSVLQGKRLRFFWILTACVFVYEWFPEYIAPLLGAFNIVCLADRNSEWVSYIFGGADGDEGMGLLGFGVDWANITSAPFYLPLSTQISNYLGWSLCYLILPLVYWGNVWQSQNYPFISQNLFFEDGTLYNQSLILNPDLSLNRTAFEIYGQPYQSGSNVIYYLGINISIGATFVHIALWHGRELWGAFKDYFTGTPIDDPHYKKMLVYPEVPFWWYAATFLAAFATAMACIYTSKSTLPWWALIVGLLLSAIMLPFIGAMYAITGFNPYMTPLFQMIGAGLVPGSSQANMYFELYSGQSLTQAQSMLSDLKLGQYTKLPPRACFAVQIVGTIVGGIFNYVITQDIVNNERTILLSNEGSRTWSGQQVQSYNALAVMWGAMGPEIFGPKGTYFIVPLGCVIGLGVPIIPWLLYKRFRWEWCKTMNFAVIAYYIGDLAGGTNGYINTWMAIGLFSHFYIRRYHAGWFRKYNYLLGAAVDGGSQVFVFVYAFAVGGAGGNTVPFPTWALNPDGNADYCMQTSS